MKNARSKTSSSNQPGLVLKAKKLVLPKGCGADEPELRASPIVSLALILGVTVIFVVVAMS